MGVQSRDAQGTRPVGTASLVFGRAAAFCVCVVLLSHAGTATLSSTPLSWVRFFGIRGHLSFCDDFVETRDGGYIAVGVASRNLQETNYDAVCVKFDSVGVPVWVRTYDGLGHEGKFDRILETANGEYIVAGWTGPGYYVNLWLLRLDGSGNILWHKTIGRPGLDEYAIDAKLTADGGFVILSTSNAYGSDEDAHVLKFDASGELLWQKRYGIKFDSDVFNCVETTPDGGFLLAGTTVRRGKDYLNPWYMRLNPSGEVVWERRFEVRGGLYEIARCPDGGYLMVGRLRDSTNDGDLWVVRIAESGEVIWQRVYGVKGYWKHDEATDISGTRNGEYVVAGVTSSYGSARWWAWVMRIDPAGEIRWQRRYDVDEWYSVRILQTMDGGFTLAPAAGLIHVSGSGNACEQILEPSTARSSIVSVGSVPYRTRHFAANLRTWPSEAYETDFSSKFAWKDGCAEREIGASSNPSGRVDARSVLSHRRLSRHTGREKSRHGLPRP